MSTPAIPPSPAGARTRRIIRSAQRGVALVFVLVCVALLTILIVSFFFTVGSAHTRATGYARGLQAQLLAENAVSLVISQLRQATGSADPGGSPLAWASQPGMVRTYDSAGQPYVYYKLYSWDGMMGAKGAAFNPAATAELPDQNWASQTGVYTDLNAPVNGHYPIVDPTPATSKTVEGFSFNPSFPAVANSPANPLPMPAKWIYLLKDGSMEIGSLGANGNSDAKVTQATAANPIVGRVAFWTDDETCKVNVNTASEGSYWDVPRVNSYEEHSTRDGSSPGFSTSTPLSEEFQRMPGHPATTSLSTVLGKLLPLPASYPFPVNSSDLAQLENYYLLAPKAGTGGSKAGTAFIADNGGNPATTLTTHSSRLYASVNEMVFDTTHTKTPTSPNSLLDPATLDELKFMLTADSAAPEVNLFNKPRISLWPIQADAGSRNVKDSLLAFCSTLPPMGAGAKPYYFQRYQTYGGDGNPGSSQSATADNASVPRNQQLLAYLDTLANLSVPGFGAVSLKTKYQADLPQILTEMFDYSRSLVNTTSQALTPAYNYVPYGGLGNYSAATSIGSVLPIHETVGTEGTPTQGLGRNYTLREVSIDFYASDWVNNTAFGTPDLATNKMNGVATSGATDDLPDDEQLVWVDAAGNAVLGADGKPQYTYAGVGCPRTAKISAFVTLTPFCVSPGQPTFSPALRYEIAGLDKFSVNGQSLGFPADAVEVVRNKFHWTPESEGGMLDSLVSHAISRQHGDYWPGRMPSQSGASGVTAQTDQDDAAEKLYPFYGSPGVNITASQSLPQFGLDRVGNVINRIATFPYNMPFGTYKGRPVPTVAGTGTQWKWVRNIEAPGDNTFSFSGGQITINVFKGTGNTFNHSTGLDNPDFVQQFTINFPPAAKLPVPQVVRAQPNDDSNGFPLPRGNGINGWNASNGGDPLKDISFYTGFPDMSTATTPGDIPIMPGADSRKIMQRFTGYVPANTMYPTPSASYTGPGTAAARTQASYADLCAISHPRLLYRRGDVVRSITVDPLHGARGDMRLVAATTYVPQGWFAPTVFPMPSNVNATDGLAAYNDPTSFQIHSLLVCIPQTIQSRQVYGYEDYGKYSLPNNGVYTDDYYADPFSWNGYPANKTVRGTLLPPGTSGYSVNGDVPPTAVIGQNGAFLTSNGSPYPGDWDNGPGNEKDGPFINKADEGYGAGSNAYNDVYFTAFPKYNDVHSLKSYSPNRQICSAVGFGSLPTGVQRGLPWQTLLFCPNPAAGNNHPGFGTGAGNVTGPQARAPFTVLPDHLFLDLFWMPVVEPYAISNPLETSGKVNMNFQIVPFTYIERSTAVRAVLKSTRLLAVDPKAANFRNTPYYKVAFNSAWGDNTSGPSPTYRYPINLDATIQGGFDARFNAAANPDIFRSASEICSVFLVPQEPTQLPPQSQSQTTYFSATAAPPSPGSAATDGNGNVTGNSSYDTVAQGWWSHFALTGDNGRESPYNQIYPRLTTKSNTYQVHVRAQVVNKRLGTDPTVFDESKGDSIIGEYRGSSIVQRYVDLNNPALAKLDFATDPTASLDPLYQYRVIKETAFNP